MEVEIRDKGTTNQTIIISEIEGEMGQDLLKLIQQPDGDVIICIDSPGEGKCSIEFCTGSGGGRRPVISKKLRELIAELVKEG